MIFGGSSGYQHHQVNVTSSYCATTLFTAFWPLMMLSVWISHRISMERSLEHYVFCANLHFFLELARSEQESGKRKCLAYNFNTGFEVLNVILLHVRGHRN